MTARGLQDGWCPDCLTELMPDGPNTAPDDDPDAKPGDRVWVCPWCGAEQGGAPPVDKPPTAATAQRDADFAMALGVYNDEVRPAQGRQKCNTFVRSRGEGAELAKCLKRYGLPAVLLVFRYWATAKESRAAWYRNKDHGCGLTTMRRHWDELHGLAKDWDEEAPSVDNGDGDAPEAAPLPPPPDMVAATAWRGVVEAMREIIGRRDTQIWLENAAVPIAMDGETVVAWVPNHFFVDWIEENYRPLLDSVAKVRLVDGERAETARAVAK